MRLRLRVRVQDPDAVEAVTRHHGGPAIEASFRRIADRRDINRANVGAARKLLTLVFYGLRDGEIRCLIRPEQPAA